MDYQKIEIRKFIEIGDLEIYRDWISTISICEVEYQPKQSQEIASLPFAIVDVR